MADNRELPALMERLEKVERQSRVFRRWGIMVFVVAGVVLLIGQAAPKDLGISEKLITTEKLVLTDAAGRVRASLYADANGNGPSLVFYNLQGKPRMTLFVDQDEPQIDLSSAKEAGAATVRPQLIELTDSTGRVVSLNMRSSVAGFALEDASRVRAMFALNSDEPGLMLLDKTGNVATLLTDDEAGPGLGLWDTEGYSATLGVEGAMNPATGETKKTSAASLVLFDKEKKVIWKAP